MRKIKTAIEKTWEFLRKYISKYAWFYLSVTVLTVVFYQIAVGSSAFADWFQNGIAAFLRFVMGKVTSPLPFSLAETVILCIPVILAAVILMTVRKAKKGREFAIRYLVSVASGLMAFYCAFVWMFGIGFHTTPIDQKIDLERTEVSPQELYQTSVLLAQEINACVDEITFGYGGASQMPYSLTEMNRKLNDAYRTLGTKYSFIQTMRTQIKPVALSHWMSYTHLTGIYTFYTGEANLNIQFPDYTLPYTAAHELAHQRGISREDEANFVAFLVCMEVDDPYVRYSACLNLFEYVVNQLYTVDEEGYFAVIDSLDVRIQGEWAAYREFFKPYEHSTASEVTNEINDAYLKDYGQTQGTRSYGLVVDLAVAYYRDSFGNS